jgi:hypothetical protein
LSDGKILPIPEPQEKPQGKPPGEVFIRVEHKDKVLEVTDADFVAGVVRTGDNIARLHHGTLSLDEYMGMIVDLMNLVNEMIATLPKEGQRMITAYIAEKAHLQNISGRMNRGLELVKPKIVLPGKKD